MIKIFGPPRGGREGRPLARCARGQRSACPCVQLGEGKAGLLAVEAVLTDFAVLAPLQQLVPGALEAGHSV